MLSRGDEQRCGCAGELALAPRERLSLPFPALIFLSLPGNREPSCRRRGPEAKLVIGGERKGPGGEERGRGGNKGKAERQMERARAR